MNNVAKCILDMPQPLGRIGVEVNERGLCRLHLKLPRNFKEALPTALLPMVERVRSALADYCRTGKAEKFPPLVIDGTDFQRAVWKQLQRVKPGKVVSYSDLAKAAGYPGASRAVGTAMAKNPLPIVVPCHRVVRTGGELGNFGGGVAMKRALLAHEGARVE